MAKKPAVSTTDNVKGQVKAPNFQFVSILIRGTAPFVANNFAAEAREKMKHQQEHPELRTRGQKREPKDFEKCYREAGHWCKDGTGGIPASAFRQALVSACRLVGFKMTIAKLSVFIVADDFDAIDSSPLVRISKGTPKRVDSYVRNETGVADIRPRPTWDAGWEAVVRVRFDSDIFTTQDVHNLMTRVGVQVGVGAGRPDSKTSCGQGWGTFDIIKITETTGEGEQKAA